MGCRTYPLKNEANRGKLDKVDAVFSAYRALARDIAHVQWNLFFTTGSFDKNLSPLSGLKSPLSQRYRQTCQYQVVGMLESFTSNIANRAREIIRDSGLDDETKLHLFYINKHKLWYRSEITMPLFIDGERVEGEHVLIDPSVVKLARRIFKNALSGHRRPTFHRINLALDAKVAAVTPREPGRASSHDYWVRLSTLEKGAPVMIPLTTNPYFDEVKGDLKRFCFVNRAEDGELNFCLVKDKDRLPYDPTSGVLPLDWGLCVPFATPNGDLLGRNFFSELKKRDEILTNLAKNRSRQGFKTSSKRYNTIRGKTREYIKNELCRILNRVVEMYRPQKIVVEKLDFRNSELSRKMNRLLSTCGRNVIETKLQCLAEDYDIEIEYVNPAWTSCECHVCGWTEKKNRKSRHTFVCRYCGNKVHADVNGSRVIGSRSSGDLADLKLGRDKILDALGEIFLSHIERHPDWPCTSTQNRERRDSPATGLLTPGLCSAGRHSPKSFCGARNGIP